MSTLSRRMTSALFTGAMAASLVFPSATAFAAVPPNTATVLSTLEHRLERQFRQDVTVDAIEGSIEEGRIDFSAHTGSEEAGISITIECTIFYPPLEIICRITINSSQA